jgi:hypothetical protein
MGEASYEQEQEDLRKERDGEIIPKTIARAPEVRPEVYKDVEAMLFRGFIVLPAEIGGVDFVFKSLNQHEFDTIRLIGGLRDGKEPPTRFWTQFLAHCVLIVDGINVLAERAMAMPKLTDLFESLPRDARKRLIRYLSEVNRRATNAVTLTEAYTMERTSRFRWAQTKGLDLSSTAITGLEGTQSLGLNWAQLMWRALNYYEDMEYENERDWENAKFVGSCFAGKGLTKIYSQDTRRRDAEREEKAARKDRLLRHVLLGEPLEASSVDGVVVKVAHTVEELAHQLEADLKGEQDFHDRVVAGAEEHIRDQHRQRRQQLEELVARREKEYNGRPLAGGTDMTGLRPEEVRERIVRRRQIDAQAAASRMVHPELEDPKMLQFLDKIGATGSPEVDSRISQTDRDVSNVVPLPPTRGPGTPFRR